MTTTKQYRIQIIKRQEPASRTDIRIIQQPQVTERICDDLALSKLQELEREVQHMREKLARMSPMAPAGSVHKLDRYLKRAETTIQAVIKTGQSLEKGACGLMNSFPKG